jgi:hypothetical protein
MGGIAGAIPSSFTQASMDIDYVRVYQNTLIDTEGPTNFTASWAVTGSSVELFLNAKDSDITYDVAYGTKTFLSQILLVFKKSAVVPDLSPNTSYTFTVTATDLAGNQAAINL